MSTSDHDHADADMVPDLVPCAKLRQDGSDLVQRAIQRPMTAPERDRSGVWELWCMEIRNRGLDGLAMRH